MQTEIVTPQVQDNPNAGSAIPGPEPLPGPGPEPTPTPIPGSDSKEAGSGDDSKSGGKKDPDNNGGINLIADKVETQTLKMAKEITEIGNLVIHNKSGGAREFEFKAHADRIKKEAQDRIATLFVADPAHIADLRERLNETRILILIGEAGIGKRTLAIYLGGTVGAQSDNENDEPKQTYVVESLERQVRIDLKKICDGRGVPNDTFLIFHNACDRGNRDVAAFLSKLNEFSLAECSEKLRKINSYLVFTIRNTDADQLKLNLGDVQWRIGNLSRDLLAQGLEKRLDHWSQKVEKAGERLRKMREQQELLLSTLKTMPRLAEFVDYYIRASANTDVPLDLEAALRSFDSFEHWFQKDLSNDFQAWCFALSLGLAHFRGESHDVSWFAFESLRRSVFSWLKTDPQLFPGEEEPRETNWKDHPEKKPRLIDDDFLEVCRAEIVKDRNSLSDLILFRDKSHRRGVWEILLKHHRTILHFLLPHLSEAVEDGTNSILHRMCCAQIIGRIGEIDPDRITLELMQRWMYSDDTYQQVLVGALYQGILASDSERYRRSLLDRLSALSNSEAVIEDEEKPSDNNHVSSTLVEEQETQEKKRERKEMLTATAVYAHIGDEDFDVAMRGLERIAEKKLVPLIEDVQRLGRLIERTESYFANRLTKKQTIQLLVVHEKLGELIGRLYNQQRYTFAGVLTAFWVLCLNTDLIKVLAELRRWMKTSNQATGALIAFMFLSEDGIAAKLESQRFEIAADEADSSERSSCNAILASLKREGSVPELARFLVTLYESFSVSFVFPSRLTRYLQESLMLRLKTWAEEALPIETCRHTMEQLFVELMHVHQKKLFDPVFRLLHDKEFGKKHPELKKSFVDAVLWQSR